MATTSNPLDDTIIATLEFNGVTVAAAVFAILTHVLPDAGYLLGSMPYQRPVSVAFEGQSVRQMFDELARLAGCTWTETNGVIEFAAIAAAAAPKASKQRGVGGGGKSSTGTSTSTGSGHAFTVDA